MGLRVQSVGRFAQRLGLFLSGLEVQQQVESSRLRVLRRFLSCLVLKPEVGHSSLGVVGRRGRLARPLLAA